MTPHHNRQRKDHRPIIVQHLPRVRHERRRQHNHRRDEDERDDEREPEAFRDLWYLEPEVRALDLFLGCTPGDVVREEVREEGLGEVDAEAAEEEEAVRVLA